jgi:hypothetical protein
MDSPPIRRYAPNAPPALRGKEFLCPYTVRDATRHYSQPEWNVYYTGGACSRELHKTFKTEREALHCARTLNALDLSSVGS